MPLTGAERAKRYRENLKKNPEKHESYRKKQLERVKKFNRTICSLSERDKQKVRKRWREQKRKQKKQKELVDMTEFVLCDANVKEELDETNDMTINETIREKSKVVNNSLVKSRNKQKRLNLTVGRLRKQLQQTKLLLEAKEKRVQELEKDKEKLNETLQQIYKEICKNHDIVVFQI